MTNPPTKPVVTQAALKPCRADNHLIHGHARHGQETPTYVSWQSMLARCRYTHRDTANKHIGRGISVCDRWRESYQAFLEDMGDRPIGTTLDRIDNNGDYEPSNCKWSTPIEQARNRRNAKLTFDSALEVALARLSGEPATSIAKRFGISESLPREIAKGRTWKDALAAAKEILNV